jgi:carboxypeptidase C (cathepsin A)
MKTILLPVLMLSAWIINAQEAPRRGPRPDRTNPPPSAPGAEAKKDETRKEEANKEETKPPVATIPDASRKPVLTTNSVSIAGKTLRYISETGMLPSLKPDGTAKASVFYIAYTLESETNAPARPITFSFNGGPGSSSVWLHLGALGPRRVKMNDDGTLPKPPFSLVDNDYSVLPFTDLVFIDPVATGYSRPAKDEKADQFFGQSPDVESVGDFIRLWTTRHQRWLSPKFLCGESYGVFRSAGLAEHLHSRYGMYLNGLILVSGLLDFATLREGPGNDLPSLAYLPAFTAIAHYHKKLPPDLTPYETFCEDGTTETNDAARICQSDPGDDRRHCRRARVPARPEPEQQAQPRLYRLRRPRQCKPGGTHRRSRPRSATGQEGGFRCGRPTGTASG